MNATVFQTCHMARDFSGLPQLGVLDANSREVIGTAYDVETQRLFIASPDMLAALRLADEKLALLCVAVDGPTRTAIRSAIAKAEGRANG